MTIGSGYTKDLLAGKKTKAHAKLMQKFVSGEFPNWNAYNSPIDALRTGAILEDRYLLILPENYYPQYKATCKEMNVLNCRIDFGLVEKGEIIDFDELKTCNFNDYMAFEELIIEGADLLAYVKKHYKDNYNQVQEQLLCSGLASANIVFLAVYSYDDEVNYKRDIQENEYIKIRVPRDESIISKIKERAEIFQTIKDYYSLTIK